MTKLAFSASYLTGSEEDQGVSRSKNAHRVAQLACGLLGLYAIIFTYFALCQVTHQKRLRDVERLLTIGVLDAESGQRAYLLTDDRLFLDQYRAGLRAVDLYTPLYANALVDSESKTLYRRISALLALKRSEMELTIVTHDRISPRSAIAIVRDMRGHTYTEQIYDLLQQIESIEAQRVPPFQIWHLPEQFDIHNPNRVISAAALLMGLKDGR